MKFLIAIGVGYLLFREQVDAALFGQPVATAALPSPDGGTNTPVPNVPNIPATGNYPNTPTAPAPAANPPPSWAVGTFYGAAANGTQIALTIASNGFASANIGGVSHSGRVAGTTLTIGSASSIIEQTASGIRTTRPDNGEVIEYSRIPLPVGTPPVEYPTVPNVPPHVPQYPQWPTTGTGVEIPCSLNPCNPSDLPTTIDQW